MTQEVMDYKVDRTGWDPGPWDSEPDKLNWTTKAGLPGMIVRNHFGALCGYVAVNPDHPLYRKDYDEVEDRIDVHGSLTYSNACWGHICHIPEPGQPDNVWWFGFDCAHAFDLSPRLAALEKNMPDFPPDLYDRLRARETYKNVRYVRREVESLARQLKALG